MATAGRGHMPYLGTHLLDDRGILLLRDWIAEMKPDSADELAPATIIQRKAENEAMERLLAGDAKQIDLLLATNSGALSLLLALLDDKLSAELRAQPIAKGSAQNEPLRRDLFERFLPDSQRRQILGPKIDPAALLSIKGNAARGRAHFAGVCIACHRARGAGIDFGPDLSHIGTKWNRAAMLDQILTPSKVIDPQWQLTTLELNNGGSKVGFITARSEKELTLKMPGGLVEQIPATTTITTITKTTAAPATLSTMPEGLLQSLTAQEAADLLEYLDSLK